MKQLFNLGDFSFSMSSRFCGVVKGVWSDDNFWHNKFVVSVCTEFGKTSFVYFDSYKNYCDGVSVLDRDNLLNALDCLFSDASCYLCSSDFDDFCADLGYVDISQYRAARKVYNACKKASEKIDRVFGVFSSYVSEEITNR